MNPKEMKKKLKIGGEIERVNGKELSYAEFAERYLAKNEPVVITGMMEDWRACTDWVTDNGEPNLRFFSAQFGNSRVQVADCGRREFTDQKRIEMSVSEFIDIWLARNDEVDNNVSSTECDGESVLYLKDWHFVKEYPEYVAYETPLFFYDDWLNIYLDRFRMHNDPDAYKEGNEISCSDYRFVYMGPKGTWTPLHADVFRSYSWSANVCGKKSWFFLPPSQRHLVFDRNMKNSIYNIFEDVDESKFPGFNKAVWLECTQERNEIIFVPSGWYHQVHNLEDTISINHNWFNAYNLNWVWNLLVGDYNEAKELIEDIRDICDDFEALCQRNLAANTGMNFYDVFTFLVYITLANLLQLHHPTTISSSSSHLWSRHIIFNLVSIRKIALKMKSTCLNETRDISLDIRKALEDPAFREMSEVLAVTYRKLHHQCRHSCDDMKIIVDGVWDLDFVTGFCSNLSTPGDLVNLIDCIVSRIQRVSSLEDMMG